MGGGRAGNNKKDPLPPLPPAREVGRGLGPRHVPRAPSAAVAALPGCTKGCRLGPPDASALALDSLMAAPRAPRGHRRPAPAAAAAASRPRLALPRGAGIPGSGADVTEAGAGLRGRSSHARRALDHPASRDARMRAAAGCRSPESPGLRPEKGRPLKLKKKKKKHNKNNHDANQCF